MDIQIHHQDALLMLANLADNSVDLVATDPPYYRIKDLGWDKQWPTEQAYLTWLETVIIECARVLKPSGSFYMFASNKLATKVECVIAKHFVVKNHIVWHKIKGLHQKVCKAKQRTYFPATERVIFAVCESNEKRHQDRSYGDACAPLIGYFRNAIMAAGLTQADVNSALGTKMAGHWFGRSQWRLPSTKTYQRLQTLFSGHLNRDYSSLKAEQYRLLKSRNHSHLRPFNVDDSDFNTDGWTCRPVQFYPGKHPCEKPQAIMQHIVSANSNEGDLVVDPFVGGGSTPAACAALQRRFIGSELDDVHVSSARDRMKK